MRITYLALNVVAALATSGAALAAAPEGPRAATAQPATESTAAVMRLDDNNGAAQIAAGRYADAERVLVAQRRVFPGDADLTINLASLYAHGGRVAEARALYEEILARPDQVVRRVDASAVSSHAMARAALSRINTVRMATR